MTPDQIKHMVARFLHWKLPEGFNPDGGISFERICNAGTAFASNREPVGTNLLDATQAEVMVRHMIDGLPHDGVTTTIVAKVDASEALAKIREAMEYPPGAFGDVFAERNRQMLVERWTPQHDDTHDGGELAAAGSCYALSAAAILNPYTQGDGVGEEPPDAWPWGAEWWKIDRDNPRRALVKAAALLIAEIERIDRAAARAEAGQ